MGTDLEKTIEELNWMVDYYTSCCKPDNLFAIKEKLAELITTMSDVK